MKKNYLLKFGAILSLLFYAVTTQAVVNSFNIGTTSVSITTPGSYTITGDSNKNGNSFNISNTAENAIYNITLNNVNFRASDWHTAILISNNATTAATVNFIIVGTNYIEAYNHGGIKVNSGVVNITFTTTSTNAQLTSTSSYNNCFSIEYENSSGTISVDPQVSCSATLNGTNVSTTYALANANTQKPLVLVLSKIPTDINPTSSEDIRLYPSSESETATLHLPPLSLPLTALLFNAEGKMVRDYYLNENKSSLSLKGLPNGFYILRVESKAWKLIIP